MNPALILTPVFGLTRDPEMTRFFGASMLGTTRKETRALRSLTWTDLVVSNDKLLLSLLRLIFFLFSLLLLFYFCYALVVIAMMDFETILGLAICTMNAVFVLLARCRLGLGLMSIVTALAACGGEENMLSARMFA